MGKNDSNRLQLTQKSLKMSEMYFDEPEYPFLYHLKKCVRLYVNLSLAVLVALIALRAFEVIYVSASKQLPEGLVQVVSRSFLYDMVFWVKLLPLFILPFVLFYFNTRFKRTSRLWFCVYGTILIITYFLLIKYYTTSLVPLGSDLFGYSISEIRQTVGTGAKIDVLSIAAFSVAIALFWVTAHIFFKHQILEAAVSFVLLCIGLALTYFNFSAIPGQ